MIIAIAKDFSPGVSMRAVIFTKHLCHSSTKSNFNPLNGIKKKSSQFTVENIEGKNIVE